MKKTGKLVAIVLAIGLIIGMIISNTTSANDIITVTAGGGNQGDESEVAVGDTVSLNLKAKFKKIVNFNVTFDEGYLRYEGCTTENNLLNVNNNGSNITISYNVDESKEQILEQVSLKFTALKETEENGTSFSFENQDSETKVKIDQEYGKDDLALKSQNIKIINGTQEEPTLTVTSESDEVIAGDEKGVRFTCSANGNNIDGIKWSSSNSEYATIDENGIAKGLEAGIGKSVTITASKDGYKSGTAELKIKEKTNPEKRTLSITPNPASVNVGDNVEFKCSASDGNTDGIKWSSSDTSCATIDENTGNARGVNPGEVKIKVSKDGYEDGVANLTVKEKATPTYPIPEVPESIELHVNESYTINISNSDKITSGIKSWTSDNTSVAKVNNGVVTAVGVGTATITVTTNDGKTGTTKVTVTPVEDSGSSRPVLTPASMIITEGYTITIKSDKPVKWELGNEGVVKIINSDTTQVTLQALKKGQAMITATSTADDTQQTTANIEVIEKSVENEGINQNGGGTTDNGGTQNGGSQGNSKTGGATTQNTSSSANEAVPATGESSVETIAILVIATLFISAIVFRKRSRIK